MNSLGVKHVYARFFHNHHMNSFDAKYKCSPSFQSWQTYKAKCQTTTCMCHSIFTCKKTPSLRAKRQIYIKYISVKLLIFAYAYKEKNKNHAQMHVSTTTPSHAPMHVSTTWYMNVRFSKMHWLLHSPLAIKINTKIVVIHSIINLNTIIRRTFIQHSYLKLSGAKHIYNIHTKNHSVPHL